MAKIDTYELLGELPSDGKIPISVGGVLKNISLTDLARKTFIIVGTIGTFSDYICDGVADQVEINAAITEANLTGKKVFIQAGTYNCTGFVNLLSNVDVFGEGYKTLINMPTTKFFSSNGQTNIAVRDLRVDAAGHVADSGDIAFQIKNSSDIWLERVYVDNAVGFGIFISSNGGLTTERVRILHCYLRGMGNNDLIGGGPSDNTSTVSDVTVDDCDMIVDATSGVQYQFAFDIVRAQRINVINNRIRGKVAYGFERNPHYMSSIDNNKVRPAIGGTFTEISITATATSTASASILSVNTNQLEQGKVLLRGISGFTLNQANVIGNIFNGSDHTHAINLEYCDSVIVADNNLKGDAVNDAIRLTNTSNSKIHHNIVDNFAKGINDTSLIASNSYDRNSFSNISGVKMTIATGSIAKNNEGVNPENLYAQGSVTGATTFNRVNGETITFTLVGNVTVTITNGLVPGDRLTLIGTQDATGGRTMSKPSNVKLVGGAFSPSSASNAVDSWTLQWDNTNWREISRSLNMS